MTIDLIRWAWEIAKGMEFLASKKVCSNWVIIFLYTLGISLVSYVNDLVMVIR